MEKYQVGQYLRDWDFLARINADWKAIRERYGLGSRATEAQIDAQYEAIFLSDPPEWLELRRLVRELTEDNGLHNYILGVYWRGLQKHERRNYPPAEVLNATLYRLIWKVARGAGGWIADRNPETRKQRRTGTPQTVRKSTLHSDQELAHWGRFLGLQAMRTELLRAIDCLKRRTSPRGSPRYTPATPEAIDGWDPEDLGSDAPEDMAAMLEAAGTRLSPEELSVFRDCLRVVFGHTDEPNALIAARHEITEQELDDILIRGLSDPKRQ